MENIRQKAEGGSAQAQYEYANQLKELGREEEAIEWYINAGRQGRADAMYEAGNYYNERCNTREAFKWYKEASEEEHAAAMYELGNFYILNWDCLKAVDLYIKAASKGFTDALAMLTKLHNKLEEERNGNISVFLALPAAGANAGGRVSFCGRRNRKANECKDDDINKALGALSRDEREELFKTIDVFLGGNSSLI